MWTKKLKPSYYLWITESLALQTYFLLYLHCIRAFCVCQLFRWELQVDLWPSVLFLLHPLPNTQLAKWCWITSANISSVPTLGQRWATFKFTSPVNISANICTTLYSEGCPKQMLGQHQFAMFWVYFNRTEYGSFFESTLIFELNSCWCRFLAYR